MSRLARLAAILLGTLACAAADAADKGPVPVHTHRPDGVPVQIGPDWISPAIQPELIRLDARTRPVLPRWKPGDPIREIPRRYIGDPRVVNPGRGPVNPEPGGLDPLAELQRLYDGAGGKIVDDFTVPVFNFNGLGNTGVSPSDVNGDVGADHYIQSINGSGGANYIIYNKSDASVAAGPFNMEGLGSGGNCATGGGDAVVLYDELADRWVLTEFTGNNSADLCIYVSAGSDPVNTTWARYVFAPLAGSFPDYPHYGVWPDAYYVGTNQGNSTRPVCALERIAMLAGGAAQMKCFNVARLAGFGFQLLMPVDHDGDAAPPAGAPGVFIRHRDDEAHNSGSNDPTQDFLELFQLTTNWVTPASASLAGPIQVPIASFDSNLNGLSAFQAFPQPNGQLLDPLREPVMHRVAYRNFGGYETIVGNFVTDVDGADTGGVRWFELRRSGGIANPWTKFNEGTMSLADAGSPADRWMGAVAMDKSGNLALGYSVVRQSPAIHPGMRYTGRLAGDAPGVMTTGEITMVNGAASQTNERWGDYHSMSVDPEDGCTFWFTAQYTPAAAWSTRIGAMRHLDCGSPEFMIDATPLSQEVCLGPGSTPLQPINVDIGRRLGYSNPVTLSFGAGLPAGFSGSFTVNPVVPPGASVGNVQVSGGTSAGSYPITVRGSALGVDKDVALTAILSTANPATPALVSPDAGAINQSYTPILSWNAVPQALRYVLEVATDAGFANIVYTDTFVGTSHQVSVPLAPATVHHWRVRAENACGSSTFSAARTFTTLPAPDVCPSGSSASQVFFDNMESGANGWTPTPSAGTARWRQVTTLSFSPATSWKGNNVASVSDQRLDSPTIALPAAGTALTLQFQHSRDVEDNAAGTICFDGGRLEISLDGGTVYTPVPEAQILVDPYDHAVASGFLNPLAGERAWCGLQAFTKAVVDLTPYRGNSAKLRFRLGTDNEVAADGWYVDDVKVQNCAAGAPAADVAITKTDGTANATAGTQVAYTIVVSNLTATAITGVAVADTFPASLGSCSWTCSAGAGSSCTASGNGNISTSAALAASGSVTYSAQCTLSAGATGTVSNTATATYANDPNGANNSATDLDTILQSANLAISKTDSVASVTAGGSTTYTLVASNAGPSAAASATVTDTIPAGLTCTWTCAGGSGGTCGASGSGNISNGVGLPVGGTATYTVSCNVSPTATGSISNTASIASAISDPNGANNSATDLDTVTQSANLAITKTDGVASITAGGSTTYTVIASNAGPSAAASATVTDTIPAGLTCTWTCAGGSGGTCGASGSGNISDGVGLPVGGTATYTVSCNVGASATGSISNTASIASAISDPNAANNSATDVDTVSLSANLAMTKTDSVASVTAGGSTIYTLVASNAGPSAVASATVTDTIPAGLTCTWTCAGGSGGTCGASGNGNISDGVGLPVGGTATYTVSCNVSAGATGSISNTASIASAISDPNAANNSATDLDTVTQSANLAISKSDGVASVTAGGSTTYTLIASNAGPSAVASATVTDTIPAGLTCTWTCAGGSGGTCGASGNGNISDGVGLPVGGTATYTVSCNVSAGATGSISNTASIASAISDPNGANNSATDLDTVTQSANLAMSKSDGVASVTAGGSTTYTLIASNAGPSAAASATVTDTIPAGLTCNWTCAGGNGGTCGASGSGNISNGVSLPVGGTATYTVSCNVSPTASGSISNTASIASAISDPNGANNSATDLDTVTQSANVAITKTDGVTAVMPGSSTTYTVVASNAGPSAVASATVADTIPAGLTCSWTCSGSGGGTCGASGNGSISDTVALPVGGSATYTIPCTVSAGASGSIVNTATITAANDPDNANNSATDTDTVGATANLAITKTNGTASVTAGASTIYTLVASNAGPTAAPSATVTDTIPAGLSCSWTCAGGSGGTCGVSGNGNISDTAGLPVGGTATYTVTCSVSPAANGSISNTATVASAIADPNAANNSATDTDTVALSANLAITKNDGVASVTAGGSTSYTLVASNAGPSVVASATVTDTIPAGLTCSWTCAGSNGGSCGASGNGSISDSAGLPVGGTATYTVACNVSPAATGSISNTASIASGVSDPNAANNTATDQDTVAQSADLAISKTDSAANVSAGGTTTYTIVASNAGPSAVASATVADTIPAGLTCTWTCAAGGGASCGAGGNGNISDGVVLPVGGTATYTLVCNVGGSATGNIANTATISSAVSDPGAANNTATDTDTVTPSDPQIFDDGFES